MESKPWSDQESDDNESKDTDRSEGRRPPVLPLGTIYQREVAANPEPVEREHERTDPEVAQSIIPGIPELSLSVPQGEQFQFQLPPAEAAAENTEEDDSDDDEESKEENAAETKQVKAPLPVAAPEVAEPQTTLGEDIAQAVQDIPAAEPVAQPEVYESTEPTPVAVGEAPVEIPPATAPVEAQTPYYPPSAEQPPMVQPSVEQPQFYAPVDAGGNQPPQPPLPPEVPVAPNYPQPEAQRWPDQGSAPYAAAAYNAYPTTYTQPQYGGDTVTKRDFERLESDSRRKMAAAVITSLAIGWYLGHRKVRPLREQVQTLQKDAASQNEQLTRLEGQQQAARTTIEQQNEQLRQYNYEQPYQPAAPPQPRFETVPGVPVTAQTAPGAELPRRPAQPLPAAPQSQEKVPHIIGGDGQEIVLQEGQHYERAAGGYGMVINERGQVVQDAIEYGESFQQDRLPERMPTPFGTHDARFKNGVAPVSGGGGGGGGGVPQATLTSGQVPQDHTLSAGPAAGRFPSEEAQHLLEAPKANPVVSAITSPWLWLGVGILMAAFFAAATI